MLFLQSLATDDIEISIADVAKAGVELARFQEVVAVKGVTCDLEFTELEKVPVGAERLVYSAHITVGEATFCAIVERPVISEDATSPQRRLGLGSPRIIESYAGTGEVEVLQSQLQADVEREINQSNLTLGIADIQPAFEGSEIRIYGSPGFDRADI
ncbi:hypothetical protein FJV83_08725 [Mesorhizobium sp. WSM4307]|uniref:hypothetical protein n=1 Tax=unclassified Mesorhizobium TaxID=325217 RepID=UPI00115F1C99|nr:MULTISPECIES: hypothetical protein [unclassified Mesorhizobium]TRC75522.1 hypothetical protein FJV81_17275 [Mesorhizobium sp. WSM4315]TRC83240.1 hypothetical protein FJV80_19765 [Mesorhizobium sp. WSM4310]TRC86469.1 hypothetical protein FJV83_08725 [Mesorhizobium sp. WSM4307]